MVWGGCIDSQLAYPPPTPPFQGGGKSDGFAGIDGAFRFGKDNVAERALEVKEIRGGTTTVVSPAPAGFGK